MKIVIVGGGTAGWAAALIICRRQLGVHDITVIESTKIGVIGVGESTTGLFTNLITNELWDLGCDHDELIAETGATLKYGIKHKGWTNDINKHYFGPIDGSETMKAVPDPFFAFAHACMPEKDLPRTSLFGNNTLDNTTDFTKNGDWQSRTHAMHVDAHLIGQYFKKICLKNKVKHIDTEVSHANLDENGFIKSVNCSDNTIVEGDFFIDCSGFNRILMKQMGAKWNSFQKNLPINTGMPFQLKYLNDEVPEPFTTAWAQSAGWMWQIPLLDRKGCGYVFCDAYTTPDKAKEEIEMRLGREIEPIKIIKFDTGRQESSWIKNCLAIGLSSAFLEPLEATSIHTTIAQITWFAFEFLKPSYRDTINPASIEMYNKRTRRIFDDTKDFLVAHYMGRRTDSEFWKYIDTGVTKTEFVDYLLETCKSRLPSINDFPEYYGSIGWPLYSHVLAGIGRLPKEVSTKALNDTIPTGNLKSVTAESYFSWLEQNRIYQKDKMTYKEFVEYFRQKRQKWKESQK
jgi:hypothetical protein